MSGPSQKGSLCSDGVLPCSFFSFANKDECGDSKFRVRAQLQGNRQSGWAHRHPCPAAPSFGDGEQRSTLHVPARVPLFVFGFVYLCLGLDTLKQQQKRDRERARQERMNNASSSHSALHGEVCAVDPNTKGVPCPLPWHHSTSLILLFHREETVRRAKAATLSGQRERERHKTQTRWHHKGESERDQ